MIVEVCGEYKCKNCDNVFVWCGLSKWNQSYKYAIIETPLKNNESRASEYDAPDNGVYCFKIHCPKCYTEEVVRYNPETDEYLGHDKQQ